MATPLKIRDGSGNIQQLTTAEENYIAYQIGLHLSSDSANGVGGITTNAAHTSIGTYTNTFFNEPVGTHPGTSITSGSSVTTLYQNQGTAAETDSDVELPMMWIDSASETGFKQMPSADLDEAVDRYLSKIFTSDYPGAFKLGSTSPGADYSVWLSTVFTDTRTDGTSVAYNIYRRDDITSSPPATVRPMYVRDGGGFDGIQAMTDRKIKYSFGQRAKTRIGSSKIGSYQIRSSAAGAPTDPGTWISAGAATDTKQTTSQQTFTTVFTAQYATVYTKAYTRTYTGDYTNTYTGNYVNTYTGAYNKVYTGNYLRTFVGNYTRAFAGTYERAFGGVAGGVFSPSPANFAAYFARNYTNTYVGTYQRDGFFSGGSVTYQGQIQISSGSSAGIGSYPLSGVTFYAGYNRGSFSVAVAPLSEQQPYPATIFWWGPPQPNLGGSTGYQGVFDRPSPAGTSPLYPTSTYPVTKYYVGGPETPVINYQGDKWMEVYPRFGLFAVPTDPSPTGSIASTIWPNYLRQFAGTPNPLTAIDGIYSVYYIHNGTPASNARLRYTSGTGASQRAYTQGSDFPINDVSYLQELGMTYSGPGTMKFSGEPFYRGGVDNPNLQYQGTGFFGGNTGTPNYLGPSSMLIYYQYTGPSRYQSELYTSVPNYTSLLTFENSFNRPYQRNYTSVYTGGPYDGVVPANYTGGFVGYYDRIVDSINYTRDYTSTSNINYSRSFDADYTSTTNVDYTSTSDVNYDNIYSTDYITDYVGNFEGLTIDATNETIETYTLYVRIS